MAEVTAALDEYFWFFFVGILAWLLLGIRRNVKQRSENPPFPSVRPSAPVYMEESASGRSLQDLASKLGGAGNILEVLVFEDQLWIRPRGLFAFLSHGSDLDHLIRFQSITSVEAGRYTGARSFKISYVSEDGESKSFELVPADAQRFLASIGGLR